jgi:hypothetical protein
MFVNYKPKRAWLLTVKRTNFTNKTNTTDINKSANYKYIFFIIISLCVGL